MSTAAHAAEWPKPGVQMQFIAKSGGNEYHGSLYADYESRHWQASNVDEGQIARGLRHGGLSPRDTNRLGTTERLQTWLAEMRSRSRLDAYRVTPQDRDRSAPSKTEPNIIGATRNR